MFQNHILQALYKLGSYIQNTDDDALSIAMAQSKAYNAWFTLENQEKALNAIARDMLDAQKIAAWQARYAQLISPTQPKHIGIVMAGNLPLVGFHDFLCVLVAGHRAIIKLSDKDRFLLPCLVNKLIEYEPIIADNVKFVERISDIDGIIATGSNNTSRYFEQYFGKYPHIIRKNRTSVAILTGNETDNELHALGTDIFSYFGLGCRNVSKLYVPQGYDFERLLEKLHEFNNIVLHDKYKNNFDYHFTLVILNQKPHKNNGCLILVEDEALHSRIAMLHYTYYSSITAVAAELQTQRNEIQCIVAAAPLLNQPTIPFGITQSPELWDYADNIDTLMFLSRSFW